MNNIIAFIPARGGSKSVLGKNLKLLGNRPLIAWSIDSAFKAGIKDVVVNTDDEEIAKVAKEYGAEVMMRSPSLAKDDTSMLEVLRSEIPKIKSNPDLILLLQPTSPLRKTIHIKTAISYLEENLDKYDSLVSVEKVPERYNPYAMILENKKMIFRKLIGWEKIKSWFTGKKYVMNLSGFPISQRMTRRQDLPQAWLPTGEIYAFKPENLKKGSIYGNETLLYECEGSLNLNTLDDWSQAEQQLENKGLEEKLKELLKD